MAAEELGVSIASVEIIDGDTHSAPNEGFTSGSLSVIGVDTELTQAANSADPPHRSETRSEQRFQPLYAGAVKVGSLVQKVVGRNPWRTNAATLRLASTSLLNRLRAHLSPRLFVSHDPTIPMWTDASLVGDMLSPVPGQSE